MIPVFFMMFLFTVGLERPSDVTVVTVIQLYCRKQNYVNTVDQNQ